MAVAIVGDLENVIIHLLMMQAVRVRERVEYRSYATTNAAQVTLFATFGIHDDNLFGVLVNGEWSGWSSWSECSKKCGRPFGRHLRTRKCDSPPPECGGHTCSGHNNENEICNKIECSGKKKRFAVALIKVLKIYRILLNMLAESRSMGGSNV